MKLTLEEEAAIRVELYHDIRSGACIVRDFNWELNLRLVRAERKKARRARPSFFARIRAWWGRPSSAGEVALSGS